MLELTGMGSVLRGIGFLYWVLAIGALTAAIYFGRGSFGKIMWSVVALVLFSYLPCKTLIEQHQRDAYAKEAWAYFKKMCDEKSGEKIYKTYGGVKSVLIVKPLPPATDRDHFDQFWYGDPYSASAHSQRGMLEAAILASPDAPVAYNQLGRGFDFVELERSAPNDFIKYYYPQGVRDYIGQAINRPVSRFSISWEDISTPEDRKYWVAGSRLLVIDLSDNSVVAERVGYFIETGFGSTAGQRRPWLTSRGPSSTCPSIRNGNYEDRWFILKVLNPGMEKSKAR